MSRSAFAARFSDLVGEPPVAYVTTWRMDVAARRAHGVTPGAFARHDTAFRAPAGMDASVRVS